MQKLANNVFCLQRKINLQVNLKLFESLSLCHDKANSSSNIMSKVNVALPCLRQPLSLFHANAEEEGEKTRMHMKMMLTNMTMTSILKVMAMKVLRVKTFVIGKISNQISSLLSILAIFRVHYKAKCYQVQKAIQEAICLKTLLIVDQVVIAKKSKGESQGCAFVTVCWDSYMLINYYSLVEIGDEIPDDPHAYNEFLQDQFCSKAGRERTCGS